MAVSSVMIFFGKAVSFSIVGCLRVDHRVMAYGEDGGRF